ncbi:MAG TPA: hypothetical protein VFB68_12655 [Xanthobacteraceae bacterium]|nr:hypothetical protein [Xanthobacteraceae bacterium]
MARRHDGERWTVHTDILGVGLRFGGVRSVAAFTWASNSQFVWTATQERVAPSNFATGAMQPVKAGPGGGIERLPRIDHQAGTLDALLWAGGDGLAVAQFGTRGGLYRPEFGNPSPTFAFVDAQRGAVLDSLPFAGIERLRNRKGSAYARVRDAATTVLKNGKVRALLNVGEWVSWTQDEAPNTVPDPYPDELHNRMTLSPDGSRVLVARLLRTVGTICVRGRGCTLGKPVEGVLAALHDVATGQPVWTIRTTATGDPEYPTPAISPDGRHALIGLFPTDRAYFALVSMERGEILQTIPAPGGAYAIGFARDGRTVWAHAYGVTALYDVNPGK